jgi:Family of unknown function (DUF6573)
VSLLVNVLRVEIDGSCVPGPRWGPLHSVPTILPMNKTSRERDPQADHIRGYTPLAGAAVETIPQQYSHEDIEGRLWDVLWMASLAARRAKPGCSRIAFEVILHIEGTRRKYQTLILDIGPGDTPEPVITIGFPADF